MKDPMNKSPTLTPESSDEAKAEQKRMYHQGMEKPVSTNDPACRSVPFLKEAKQLLIAQDEVCVSFFQHKFHLGYCEALNILEELERKGCVKCPNKEGKWEVLHGR